MRWNLAWLRSRKAKSKTGCDGPDISITASEAVSDPRCPPIRVSKVQAHDHGLGSLWVRQWHRYAALENGITRSPSSGSLSSGMAAHAPQNRSAGVSGHMAVPMPAAVGTTFGGSTWQMPLLSEATGLRVALENMDAPRSHQRQVSHLRARSALTPAPCRRRAGPLRQ